MKILQIDYTLGAGGAERFVVDLCNGLSKENEVTMCTVIDDSNTKFTFHKQFLSNKVRYINLGCKSGLSLKAVNRIIKVIKDVKPDVVHGHQVSPLLIFPSLLFPDIRFIATLHNIAEKCLSFPLEKYINKYLFRHKRIIPVTISDICYDSFVKLYHLKSAYKVDNGRTFPRSTPLVDNVKEEINNYKNNIDDLVFIHVARFCPQKNQNVLINVFNNLKYKHLILLVLGEKFDSVGSYLKKKANPNIHFLGAKNNVVDYLLNSDFFCLTSLWEGLPISLLEAMACKVIPICTPVGGIPNVIEDKKTGYLSPDCTEKSYEKTIIEALNNYHEIDKNKILQEYTNRFSMEKCISEYIKIYYSK